MKPIEEIELILKVPQLTSIFNDLQASLNLLSLFEDDLSNVKARLPTDLVDKWNSSYINILEEIQDQADGIKSMARELIDI